jgi:hypothetical protein
MGNPAPIRLAFLAFAEIRDSFTTLYASMQSCNHPSMQLSLHRRRRTAAIPAHYTLDHNAGKRPEPDVTNIWLDRSFPSPTWLPDHSFLLIN